MSNQNPIFPPSAVEQINTGTVMTEGARAIAEAQGKLTLAKNFPRNKEAAYKNIIEACRHYALAEKAIYSFPRGKGNTVTGPSIRLAEELARCWGNVEFGTKELSQKNGESEMLAFCWDLETNTMSSQTFTVKHMRDTRGGVTALTDQRDIYENNANMAARRLRARILAILPPDYVDAAIKECQRTISGANRTDNADDAVNLQEFIPKMTKGFAKIGVSVKMLEERLGRKIDTMSYEDITEYMGIYNSLKDGSTSVASWFDVKLDADKSDELTELVMGGK